MWKTSRMLSALVSSILQMLACFTALCHSLPDVITCKLSSVLTVSGLQCARRHLLAEDLNNPTMLPRGMSAFDVYVMLCRA